MNFILKNKARSILPLLLLLCSACQSEQSNVYLEEEKDIEVSEPEPSNDFDNVEFTYENIQLGTRPYYLVDDMDDGDLKNRLKKCGEKAFYKTDFSIGHRGAPMQYPEHTKESYQAAARMGAGILECDVTFTQDQELVCRHSQCDLHTTTNILAIPELAEKCSIPFIPADPASGIPAQVKCCTSDITLAEFKTLKGKMDSSNPQATTIEEYMDSTPSWRTDLYSSKGTLLSHKESISLFNQLGLKMTPELKAPMVDMPFDGFSQEDYAQKLINEYIELKIPPNKVYPQSSNLDDVKYWIKNNPEYTNTAIYLDGRYGQSSFDPMDESTWQPTMAELVADGVKIIAPPLWVLVTIDRSGNIAPSTYSLKAKEAGLDIIAWTLERSGSLSNGGGWYYKTVSEVINKDGDMMVLLDVLAKDVGVIGVFSDWPATTTYYANCMNI